MSCRKRKKNARKNISKERKRIWKIQKRKRGEIARGKKIEHRAQMHNGPNQCREKWWGKKERTNRKLKESEKLQEKKNKSKRKFH